jgi:hypothetical protein
VFAVTTGSEGIRRIHCQALADSSDLVEALQEATDILKMEFADTDGSGRETLHKCEKALQRTRSICTLELTLY